MVETAKLAFDLAMPTEAAGIRCWHLRTHGVVWRRRLFEKASGGFCRETLKAAGWRVSMDKMLHWPLEDCTALIEQVLPPMKTALVLEHFGRMRRIIVDTKLAKMYSRPRYREKSVISARLAYLRSQEGTGVLEDHTAGLLLYPSVGESLNETVSIQGHLRRFATVDLTASTTEIRQQLLDVVKFE
ncbi:MAG: hypothetical protein M1318_06580 [Firmicutes bacterium]|nr:hypothetical protein [Bacillota bacterium]